MDLFRLACVVVTALSLGLWACHPALAEDAKAPNLVANGSFEDGEAGWQYEQWDKKPLPGAIDKDDHVDGAASFKFSEPNGQGGRYLAKEVQLSPGDRRDLLLSFAMKTDGVPDGAAHVRVGIEGKGWFGSSEGKSDVVKTGGTQDWKTYQIPISADAMGDAPKLTLFFYHDQVNQGVIKIDAVSLKAWAGGPLPGDAASRGPVLRGDTSHPTLSTFVLGQPVELTFTLADLKDDRLPLDLSLDVVDEHGKSVRATSVPVTSQEGGTWKTTISAPADKLGFYRVYAKLSDGTPLASLGSRRSGFLTYAVVPDPAQRRDYGEFDSRFGMQGGFGPWADEALPMLGARWVLDGTYEWRKQEPDRAGQFKADEHKRELSKSAWRTYSLPTLFAVPEWAAVPETMAYMTGKLTPEGESAWDAYCRQAVRAYAALNPDRQQRIYQITWEPIAPWGFKGTNEDLVRIYQIAYRAIHEADPRGAVAGPTRGIEHGDPQKHVPLFKAGLGQYLDAFSTHPYYAAESERDGMVRDIRAMKNVIATHAGKDLAMLGTEQGLSTTEDPEKDLNHARRLMRQNLITLGEGFRFNMAFYIVDYRLSGQSGYGYYYNLVDHIPFGPAKIAPRPVAPAYAAQSLLLDGHTSVGAIEWLGETSWGYAFQRDDDVVLALWDYGSQPRTVTIPVGAPEIKVYDWMGNARNVASARGQLSVAIGPEPIYVTGVASTLWGRQAKDVIAFKDSQLEITPGGRAVVRGAVRLPADRAFTGTLELSADDRLKIAPLTRAISFQAGQAVDYSFELPIPSDAPPAAYPVRLSLNNAELTVATAGAVAQVMPPVAVVNVEPVMLPDGSKGLAVTLRNRQSDRSAGSVQVELAKVLPAAQRPDLPMIDLPEGKAALQAMPGTRQQLAFALEANASQRLVIPYASVELSPTQDYQARVMVTTDAGYSFTHNASVHFLFASRHTPAPTVDGDLQDWAAVPPAVLAGKDAVTRSPQFYQGEADLAATLRFSWDERNLYVAAEVTDDVFSQPYTGTLTWRGDCLQLAFDPQARAVRQGTAESQNTELAVALTAEGVQVFRHLTFDTTKLPLGLVPADQVTAVVKQNNGRLIYELAIPWAAVGIAGAPTAGDALGIAMAVNDSDAPDQEDPSAMGLFGGIAPAKDPSKFGLLLLTTPTSMTP